MPNTLSKIWDFMATDFEAEKKRRQEREDQYYKLQKELEKEIVLDEIRAKRQQQEEKVKAKRKKEEDADKINTEKELMNQYVSQNPNQEYVGDPFIKAQEEYRAKVLEEGNDLYEPIKGPDGQVTGYSPRKTDATIEEPKPQVRMTTQGFTSTEPKREDFIMDRITRKMRAFGEESLNKNEREFFEKNIASTISGKHYEDESPILANIPQLEPNASPEEKEQFLSQLTPEDRSLVKGLADYKLDLTKVTSIRGGQRKSLASLVTRFDPTFDMNLYNARKNFMNKYTAGTLADNRISINTAILHIGTLADKLDKLQNARLPAISAVTNPVKYALGKKEMAGVKASILAVSNELAKAFKGAGVSSEQEIKEFRSSISSNSSPEQQYEYLSTFLELLDGRIQSVKDQYVEAMGKDPEDILNERTLETLQKINEVYSPTDDEDVQSNESGVSEEDLQFTMDKYGMTREEVLQQLGAQ